MGATDSSNQQWRPAGQNPHWNVDHVEADSLVSQFASFGQPGCVVLQRPDSSRLDGEVCWPMEVEVREPQTIVSQCDASPVEVVGDEASVHGMFVDLSMDSQDVGIDTPISWPEPNSSVAIVPESAGSVVDNAPLDAKVSRECSLGPCFGTPPLICSESPPRRASSTGVRTLTRSRSSGGVADVDAKVVRPGSLVRMFRGGKNAVPPVPPFETTAIRPSVACGGDEGPSRLSHEGLLQARPAGLVQMLQGQASTSSEAEFVPASAAPPAHVTFDVEDSLRVDGQESVGVDAERTGGQIQVEESLQLDDVGSFSVEVEDKRENDAAEHCCTGPNFELHGGGRETQLTNLEDVRRELARELERVVDVGVAVEALAELRRILNKALVEMPEKRGPDSGDTTGSRHWNSGSRTSPLRDAQHTVDSRQDKRRASWSAVDDSSTVETVKKPLGTVLTDSALGRSVRRRGCQQSPA